MAIDPSIAMGVRPVQTPNMLAEAGQAAQLQTSMMQNAAISQEMEGQNALRKWQMSGGDLNAPDAPNQMLKMGVPLKAVQSFVKTGLEQRKLGGEVTKQDLDITQRIMGDLANNPSNENITANVQDLLKANRISSTQAQSLLTQALQVPVDKRSALFTKMALDAKTIYQGDITKRGQDISANTAQRGQDLTYAAATQPVFNEAVGGFVTRPTAANPSSTVIPLANPEATTKGQVVAKGKNLVNDVATDMATSYGVLKDLGGIKSRENSPQKNISAALQSSMVGQIGGSMMGTAEQDARDAIMSQRPILVQAIVKATGMSSQQINSNQELKNMLDAATDPSKGYETNIKTLNKINQRFGLGGDIIPLPTDASNTNKVSIGAPQKINSKIDALLKKYEEQ